MHAAAGSTRQGRSVGGAKVAAFHVGLSESGLSIAAAPAVPANSRATVSSPRRPSTAAGTRPSPSVIRGAGAVYPPKVADWGWRGRGCFRDQCSDRYPLAALTDHKILKIPRVGRRLVFACRMLQSIRLYGPGTPSSERVLNANGRPSARQTERNMDTRGSGSVGSVVAVKPQPGVGGAAQDLSCCACALIFFRSPSQASLMSPAERIIHPVPPSPHAAAFSHSPSTFSAPFLALSLGAPPRALPQTMAVPAL